MNDQRKCPRCGHTGIWEGDRYCEKCGAALPEQKQCPNCGRAQPGGGTGAYCAYCGSRMNTVSPPPKVTPSWPSPDLTGNLFYSPDDDELK